MQIQTYRPDTQGTPECTAFIYKYAYKHRSIEESHTNNTEAPSRAWNKNTNKMKNVTVCDRIHCKICLSPWLPTNPRIYFSYSNMNEQNLIYLSNQPSQQTPTRIGTGPADAGGRATEAEEDRRPGGIEKEDLVSEFSTKLGGLPNIVGTGSSVDCRT